jgi:hypothetical protein
MTAVEEAGEKVRRAIQGGSFGEAQQLLAVYVRAVNAALAETAPPDSRAVETIRGALDLLHWASRAVRSGRAQAAMELARLSAGRPYLARAREAAATVQLVG